MKTDKLTLLFDGNFIFHQALHVIKGYEKRSSKFLSKQKDINIFMEKLINDFIGITNNFKGYKRIIFCYDSRSWRKTFYPEYKANRKKQQKDDTDWSVFFNLIKEFGDLLKLNNVIASSIDGFEGDDLLHLWSKYLFDNGEDSIVITADSDLTQIVEYGHGNFVGVYNNKSSTRKIIMKDGFEDWAQTAFVKPTNDSLLDMTALMKKLSHSFSGTDIISNAKKNLNYEEIDPNKVRLEKVVCGDPGDNIMDIWKRKKGSAITKVYKQVLKFVETYQMGNINIKKFITDEKFLRRLKAVIEQASISNLNYADFKNDLLRNIRLVYLDKEYLPDGMYETFLKGTDNELSICEDLTAHNIFENSKYKQSKTPGKIQIISDAF